MKLNSFEEAVNFVLAKLYYNLLPLETFQLEILRGFLVERLALALERLATMDTKEFNSTWGRIYKLPPELYDMTNLKALLLNQDSAEYIMLIQMLAEALTAGIGLGINLTTETELDVQDFLELIGEASGRSINSWPESRKDINVDTTRLNDVFGEFFDDLNIE